jgi:hypothetical protein
MLQPVEVEYCWTRRENLVRLEWRSKPVYSGVQTVDIC